LEPPVFSIYLYFMLRLVGLLVLLLLASCTEVSFKEPQPAGIRSLKRVPLRLQGTYVLDENGISAGEIVVFSGGYKIKSKEAGEPGQEYWLSDSVVLKYFKRMYFLNIRENGVWLLRAIRRERNGDLIIMELPRLSENELRREEQLAELRTIAPVVESESRGSKVYVMDPRPQQLMQLIRKGYFREKSLLRKKDI
jgi:hypothetical protein